MPNTLASKERAVKTGGMSDAYAPVVRRMGNFGLPKAVVANAGQQLIRWGIAYLDQQRKKLPTPAVFATPESIIVFEWEEGENSLEVFLDSKDRVRYVLIRGEEEEEETVSPDEIPQKLALVFGS